MSIMNQVREAISASHNAIEKTPFSVSMLDGSLCKANYARGLGQLFLIHRALETCAPNSPLVRPFFSNEMIRCPAIERDLQALEATAEDLRPMSETARIILAIDAWADEKPLCLLGCIYILEGSRMGSLVIARPLSKTLGIPPGTIAGVEYHVEGAASTPYRVKQLKAQIDAFPFNASAQADIRDGAVQFMEMLYQLYCSLPAHGEPTRSISARCPFSHANRESPDQRQVKTA